MTALLTRLGRGQYSLPMAFLGFYVFGSCTAVFVVFTVLGIAAQLPSFFTPGLMLCLVALLGTYGLWTLRNHSVGRSALNAFFAP